MKGIKTPQLRAVIPGPPEAEPGIQSSQMPLLDSGFAKVRAPE
jgi:hypothetical protein